MRYTEITSPSNPIAREALKLKDKPRRDGVFLIEGPHLLEMALSSGAEVTRIFFTSAFGAKRDAQSLLRVASKKNAELVETSPQVISRLTDTETPQGIVAIATKRPLVLEEIQFKSAPLLIICDGIQDPGNLGTIIRVADAANADGVVILPGSCNPFNSKSVRATAGSLFNIPVIISEPTLLNKFLRLQRIKLIAADIRATKSLYEADLKGPLALAFGSEAHGVSTPLYDTADILIKIPILGKAESLNVATAAAVCMYEVVRQRTF